MSVVEITTSFRSGAFRSMYTVALRVYYYTYVLALCYFYIPEAFVPEPCEIQAGVTTVWRNNCTLPSDSSSAHGIPSEYRGCRIKPGRALLRLRKTLLLNMGVQWTLIITRTFPSTGFVRLVGMS